jgi:hypothetical protein
MPPTTPEGSTVALPFDATHVPPVAVVVRVIELLIHTLPEPEIVPASGAGFTVMVVVAATGPHEEVRV